MTPTTHLRVGFNDTTITTPEEAYAKYGAVFDGNPYVAAWNGHEFELVGITAVYWGWHSTPMVVVTSVAGTPTENGMIVHYPIDPRMTAADVRGATRAYANETNDGWLFAHTDADHHHDHEHLLLSAVSEAFDEEERKLHKELMQAVYRSTRHSRRPAWSPHRAHRRRTTTSCASART